MLKMYNKQCQQMHILNIKRIIGLCKKKGMEKMKLIYNNCKWAVAYKIDKETQDDRKTKINIVALFNYPSNAEEFIDNCLPGETKEKFFIIDIDELENCNDCDKVQKVTSLYAKVID